MTTPSPIGAAPAPRRHLHEEQRLAHAAMLERLAAADFSTTQPTLLADLRTHLGLVAVRLAGDGIEQAGHAEHCAGLAMLEVIVRSVAGADALPAATANGRRLAASFARFVADDLALMAASRTG